jgi:hypothetical protein
MAGYHPAALSALHPLRSFEFGGGRKVTPPAGTGKIAVGLRLIFVEGRGTAPLGAIRVTSNPDDIPWLRTDSLRVHW